MFISYRRSDSRHIAGRLADRLSNDLGAEHVFVDVDTIPAGADFRIAIREAVRSCTALIALIGPTWTTAIDLSGRRRLDDPDDTVCLEITAALDSGICVIPVLIDGATMPDRSELPSRLHPLTSRQALRIDHETFHSDAVRVVRAASLHIPPPPSQAARRDAFWRRPPGVVLVVVVFLCTVAILGAIAAARASSTSMGTAGGAPAWDSRTVASAPSADSAPALEESATESQGPAQPSGTLSARGNVEKQLGETAEFGPTQGNMVVAFAIDTITVDPVCANQFSQPAEHGHFIKVDLRAETRSTLDINLGYSINSFDFATVGDDGITESSLFTGPAAGCLDPSEQFPPSLHPGSNYRGAIVLDTKNPSGVLVLRPGFTAGGWEWNYQG